MSKKELETVKRLIKRGVCFQDTIYAFFKDTGFDLQQKRRNFFRLFLIWLVVSDQVPSTGTGLEPNSTICKNK